MRLVRLPCWVELLSRLKPFDSFDQNERLEPKLFVDAPVCVEEVKPRSAPRIFEFTGVVPLEITGIYWRAKVQRGPNASFQSGHDRQALDVPYRQATDGGSCSQRSRLSWTPTPRPSRRKAAFPFVGFLARVEDGVHG